MPTQSFTLKLPFLDLNQVKAEMFAELERVNTEVANGILALEKKVRKRLTTKNFKHIPIQTNFLNQTIRNAKAKTKVKQFKRLPLETNNQGWKLHKVGSTFSVSFNVTRDRKQRVPVQVHAANHHKLLERLLADGPKVKRGTLKLHQSKSGQWFALISLTLDVPEAEDSGRWLGVDRGLNYLAVVVTPEGQNKFYKGGKLKQVRRDYARLRKELQAAGKHKAVNRLEQKEPLGEGRVRVLSYLVKLPGSGSYQRRKSEEGQVCDYEIFKLKESYEELFG